MCMHNSGSKVGFSWASLQTWKPTKATEELLSYIMVINVPNWFNMRWVFYYYYYHYVAFLPCAEWTNTRFESKIPKLVVTHNPSTAYARVHQTLCFVSKNLLRYKTWKRDTATRATAWAIDHHKTRVLVDSVAAKHERRHYIIIKMEFMSRWGGWDLSRNTRTHTHTNMVCSEYRERKDMHSIGLFACWSKDKLLVHRGPWPVSWGCTFLKQSASSCAILIMHTCVANKTYCSCEHALWGAYIPVLLPHLLAALSNQSQLAPTGKCVLQLCVFMYINQSTTARSLGGKCGLKEYAYMNIHTFTNAWCIYLHE
jgi:hypothetical protein